MKFAIFLCFALLQIPVSLFANGPDETEVFAKQLQAMHDAENQDYFNEQMRKAVAESQENNNN